MTQTRDRRTHTARRMTAFGLVLAATWAVTGCSLGPAEAGAPIDRELFIATYVDLRVAAIDSDERVLTDSARSAVLSRHGVTAEDLLSFAEIHGREVEYMRDVWNEVELRLDGLRFEPAEAEPDSAR